MTFTRSFCLRLVDGTPSCQLFCALFLPTITVLIYVLSDRHCSSSTVTPSSVRSPTCPTAPTRPSPSLPARGPTNKQTNNNTVLILNRPKTKNPSPFFTVPQRRKRSTVRREGAAAPVRHALLRQQSSLGGDVVPSKGKGSRSALMRQQSDLFSTDENGDSASSRRRGKGRGRNGSRKPMGEFGWIGWGGGGGCESEAVRRERDGQAKAVKNPTPISFGDSGCRNGVFFVTCNVRGDASFFLCLLYMSTKPSTCPSVHDAS